MTSVLKFVGGLSVLCVAICTFLTTSGCAQSANGWQAQNQATLAADQSAGSDAKGTSCSKCKDGKDGKDGEAAGKCCKEGKGDAAGCGGKCGGDKKAEAGSDKECCKSGEDAAAQAAAPSAAK